MDTTSKICYKCKISKDIKLFTSNKGPCKECYNAKARELYQIKKQKGILLYQKDKNKHNANGRAWRKKNKEKY